MNNRAALSEDDSREAAPPPQGTIAQNNQPEVNSFEDKATEFLESLRGKNFEEAQPILLSSGYAFSKAEYHFLKWKIDSTAKQHFLRWKIKRSLVVDLKDKGEFNQWLEQGIYFEITKRLEVLKIFSKDQEGVVEFIVEKYLMLFGKLSQRRDHEKIKEYKDKILYVIANLFAMEQYNKAYWVLGLLENPPRFDEQAQDAVNEELVRTRLSSLANQSTTSSLLLAVYNKAFPANATCAASSSSSTSVVNASLQQAAALTGHNVTSVIKSQEQKIEESMPASPMISPQPAASSEPTSAEALEGGGQRVEHTCRPYRR